jgi:hypothetical protein
MATTAALHKLLRVAFAATELTAVFLTEPFLTAWALLGCLLALQFAMIATGSQMQRRYEFRNPSGRSFFEALVSARIPLAPPDPRNPMRDRVFIFAFIIDACIRFALLSLLLLDKNFRSNFSSTVKVIIFSEQWAYLLLAGNYAVTLLVDQDYLRNTMEWIGLTMGRVREIGYHNVYPCGFQFSAFPGMMFMLLPLLHGLPNMFMAGSVALITLRDSIDSTDGCFSSGYAKHRLSLIYYDVLVSFATFCLVPLVFWMQDAPRPRAAYLLSGIIGVVFAAAQFCIMILYRADLIRGDNFSPPDCEQSLYLRVIFSILCAGQFIYALLLGIFLCAMISMTEYLDYKRKAWKWFLCIVNNSRENHERANRFVQDHLCKSFFRQCQLLIFVEPWISLGLLKQSRELNGTAIYFGQQMTIWRAVWWSQVIIYSSVLLQYLAVFRFVVQRDFHFFTWGYREYFSGVEIVKLTVPLPWALTTLLILPSYNRSAIEGWGVPIFVCLIIRILFVIDWFRAEFISNELIAKCFFCERPEISLARRLLGRTESGSRYWNQHRELLLLDQHDDIRVSLIRRVRLTPHEILEQLVHRRNYLLQKPKYLFSNLDVSELRDLNFHMRKMALLLAAKATTSNNIFRRLAQHEVHLLRKICEYL